jgi:hypothetical protein
MGMTQIYLKDERTTKSYNCKDHSSNPGTLLGTPSFPLFQSTNNKNLSKWGR